MIDTHSHLQFPEFEADRKQVLNECKSKLDAVIIVGCSIEDSISALAIASEVENIYASVGVHPHNAYGMSGETTLKLKQLATSDKVVAIGETGLDFFRNLSPKEKQYDAFKSQVEIAGKLNLPVIIHSRNSSDEMANFIREHFSGVKGVLHCFSGSDFLLETALKCGLYISFSGSITYPKNTHIREMVKKIPSSKLLIETDSPYLPPQPVRGKRNKPVYVAYVAMELSRITGLSISDIDRITTINAKRLFNLPMTKEESSEKLVYTVRNNLYINLTDKCPCNCSFCFRGKENYILGYNLHITREPPPEEYMYRIKNPSLYDEIVFCGYGEPMERLDAIVKISKWLKKMHANRIRINTNGLAYLITGNRQVLSKLKGLIDSFNISLNADSLDVYYKTVKPSFGKGSFEAVIDFIRDAAKAGFDVTVSAVKHENLDVKKFKNLVQHLGVKYKVREYKLF